jgi:ligand-binding SRPBCC domain-containing protein
MYQLYQEQVLDANIEELWEFVSRPENLNEITPPEMDFTIITDVPDKMHNGLLVEYKVTLPIFGASEWVTELKHIIPEKQFVDEQRLGPYTFWYHYHGLEETESGIKMIDHVRYVPPYGPFGKIANSLIISSKLDEVFSYRKKVMDERFNK